MRLASSQSPAEVAWDAFDAAAIHLHALYGDAIVDEPGPDNGARAARFAAAQRVVRLWDEWQRLYLFETKAPRS